MDLHTKILNKLKEVYPDDPFILGDCLSLKKLQDLHRWCFVLDKEGRYMWNTFTFSEMMGEGKRNFLGQKAADIFQEKDFYKKFEEVYLESLLGKNEAYFLFDYSKYNEYSQIWVQYIFFPIKLEDEVVSILGVVSDVSEKILARRFIDRQTNITQAIQSIWKGIKESDWFSVKENVLNLTDSEGFLLVKAARHGVASKTLQSTYELSIESEKKILDRLDSLGIESLKLLNWDCGIQKILGLSFKDELWVHPLFFALKTTGYIFLINPDKKYLNDLQQFWVAVGYVVERFHQEDHFRFCQSDLEARKKIAASSIPPKRGWGWNLQTGEFFSLNGWVEMLGYSEEEFEGELFPLVFRKILHKADYRETAKALMDFTYGAEDRKQIQFRTLCKDGTTKLICSHILVQKDDAQNVSHILGVLVDVGELKKTDANCEIQDFCLSQANKNREQSFQEDRDSLKINSEFLINLSQEMRVPLHAILNFSQLGINQVKSKDFTKIGEYFHKIVRSAERLDILVKSFSHVFSQIKNNNLEIREHSILEILNLVLQELNEKLLFKKIKVIINSAVDHLKKVQCDFDRVSVVIKEIVHNAIKFSPDGSVINIKLDDRDVFQTNNSQSGVIICICDEGVGLNEGIIKTIFSGFSKVATMQTAELSSTGFGLYLVKLIVDQHGGAIWAANNIEKGASFSVFLPIK